ncbi:hypothetical protein SCUCBS95973_001151 [Sporothrix curviconia]|uniref:FAD-binding FR-type domain-containing protein n=1 Tax=Sporothrix curviconia TaxID=1260050 RepID=A0ABP0AWM7_9PEZI
MERRKSSSRALLPLVILAAAAWATGTAAHDSPIDDADTPSSPRHIGHAGLPVSRAPVVVRADPEVCFQACLLALREPVFTDLLPGASFRNRPCYSNLTLTSMYLCLHGYCSDGRGLDGLEHLNDTCIYSGRPPLPPMDDVLADFPPDKLVRVRHLQRDECIPDTHLSEPVMLSQQLYENSYDTLADLVYVRTRHHRYSLYMVLFWAVVILYGMANQLFMTVAQKIRRRRNGLTPTVGRQTPGYQPVGDAYDDDNDDDDDLDEYHEGEGSGQKGSYAKAGHSLARRPRVWLQRHLTTPATFGWKTSQDFGWYTVPPRVQTVTITIFVVMNIAASVCGYHAFTGNMYWPTIKQQLLRYVSDRTGVISFVNFPLIWLFGMRNNVLLWLTGWDFGTYNNFHRWVARVATVEAIVHSIGYTALVCRNGGGIPELLRWWRLFFWWTGGVATICMSLLLGLSLFYMRRNMYEVFLVVHIVFSILILFGMLFHVSIFHGTYDFFFWSCLIIWIADRVMRSLRIVAFNPLFWTTRAKATYDPNSNIVRVVVPYTSSLYQPKPGTYYYLHVLNDKRFWESHPFTVATVTTLNKSVGDDATAIGKRRRSQPQAVELDDQSDVQSDRGSVMGDNSDDGDDDIVSANSPTLQVDQDTGESAGLLYNGNYGSTQSHNPYQERPSSSHTAATSHSIASSSAVPPPAHAASALTFLIRPYDSFTGRLRDKAAAAANPGYSSVDFSAGYVPSSPAPANLRVLVDGPYGHAQRFDDDYDSLLFVVGGSGIVVPLSHLTGLGRDHTLSPNSRRRLKSIRIVWAVREAAFAAEVLREDLKEVFANDDEGNGGTKVTLDIHVTRSKPFVIGDAADDEMLANDADDDELENNDDNDDNDDDIGSRPSVTISHRPSKDRPRSMDDSPFDGPLPKAVRVLYERPDVRGEVECAAKRGRKGPNGANRKLGVIACGPGRMADEARRAVVDVLGRRGTGNIDYLEESFQW